MRQQIFEDALKKIVEKTEDNDLLNHEQRMLLIDELRRIAEEALKRD